MMAISVLLLFISCFNVCFVSLPCWVPDGTEQLGSGSSLLTLDCEKVSNHCEVLFFYIIIVRSWHLEDAPAVES